ncbi:MAG TPA: hypothetical protein VLV49_18540 [Terriglobales bacterium]|nr:hypothetical protein [Terriglobales bacterium]
MKKTSLNLRNSDALGWILALSGFLLLTSMGKLDLAILLLPIAAVFGYAITCLPGSNPAAQNGIK